LNGKMCTYKSIRYIMVMCDLLVFNMIYRTRLPTTNVKSPCDCSQEQLIVSSVRRPYLVDLVHLVDLVFEVEI